MVQNVLTERPPVVTNGKATDRSKLSGHYRALLQHIQAANIAAPANKTIETIGVTSCAEALGLARSHSTSLSRRPSPIGGLSYW